MNKRYKSISILLIASFLFLIVGCSTNAESKEGNSPKILDENVYYGKMATHEIIEVQSNGSWTIKSKNEDDMNYSEVSVTKTGEVISGLPVIRLTADKQVGDVDSAMVKRKGREFVIAQKDGLVLLRSISSSNRESVKKDLNETDDPEGQMIDIANFIFGEK